MRRLIPIFTLSLLFGAPARAAGPVSLDDAIQAALASHPSLQGARFATRAAESNRLAAERARLPGLSFSGGYLKTSTYRGSPDYIANSAPNEYRAQLGLSQTLWSGGLLGGTIDKAREDLAASQADAEAAALQLRWQVVSQYVGVLKAQEAQRINQLGLAAAEAHLREGQILLQHGAISVLDATRNQLDRANAQLEVERASGDLIVARAQLASTTGLAPDLVAAAPPQPAAPAGTVDDLAARALAHRPELLAVRARARAAQADARIAHAALAPQIQLVGNAGWDTDQFYGPNNGGWSWGLNVNAPVFDWNRLGSQAQAAELTARKAEEDVRQAEIGIRLEVLQAYQDRQVAERQRAIADQSVQLAEQGAKMAEVGYRMGSVSDLEVTLTRQQLVTARLKQSSARLDALLATEHLKSVVGEALP